MKIIVSQFFGNISLSKASNKEIEISILFISTYNIQYPYDLYENSFYNNFLILIRSQTTVTFQPDTIISKLIDNIP